VGLLLWLVGIGAGLTVGICRHVPVVGALAGVIAGPLFSLFGMLTVLCIVDRGISVRAALGRVLLVVEQNWIGLWAISLLFCMLSDAGAIVFGIGWVVTAPWIACAWAAMYQDLFNQQV
jgi:hypothetical protein